MKGTQQVRPWPFPSTPRGKLLTAREQDLGREALTHCWDQKHQGWVGMGPPCAVPALSFQRTRGSAALEEALEGGDGGTLPWFTLLPLTATRTLDSPPASLLLFPRFSFPASPPRGQSRQAETRIYVLPKHRERIRAGNKLRVNPTSVGSPGLASWVGPEEEEKREPTSESRGPLG